MSKKSLNIQSIISNKHGFANVDITTDNKIFLDPHLLVLNKNNNNYSLFSKDGFDGGKSAEKMDDFFQTMLSLSTNNLFPPTVFKEINSLHIGISRNGSQGTGLSDTQMKDINEMMRAAQNSDNFLDKLRYCQSGFGDDHFSDITATFIFKELCEYTDSIMKNQSNANKKITKKNKETLNWNINTHNFERYAYTQYSYDGIEFTLIPTRILVKKYQKSVRQMLVDLVITPQQTSGNKKSQAVIIKETKDSLKAKNGYDSVTDKMILTDYDKLNHAKFNNKLEDDKLYALNNPDRLKDDNDF